MENLNDPRFWVILAALLIVVWLMKKSANREGYKIGAVHGFVLGIDQVAEMLIVQNMVRRTDGIDRPLTKDELVNILTPIVTAKVVSKIGNMNNR